MKGTLKKLRWSYVEFVLAAAGAVFLGAVLARDALGGPLSTDVLGYMNAGINGIESASIINRYFHVYLQALFMKTAENPLTGIQNYWAFLVAATALMLYLAARSINEKSNCLNGMLAVALFFSVKSIAELAGIPLPDFTAMFMTMGIVLVYLLSVKRRHQSRWLLAGLGCLYYLALRTKETTWMTAILVVGLGFVEGGFNFRLFLRNCACVLLGFLAGVILYAVLSWMIIGDPLFGLRLTDYQAFFKEYVGATMGHTRHSAGHGNWYSSYLFQDFYLVFILYLLTGFKTGPELDLGRRLILWVPLVLIGFISLTAGLHFGSRILLPALPLFCLWGAQMDLKVPDLKRDRLKAGITLLAGLVFLGILRLGMRYFVPGTGWDPGLFFEVVLQPILLSILIAAAFLWKHSNLKASILILVLILALILVPILDNSKEMLWERPNQKASARLFYPLAVFSGQMPYTPEMRMYVSLEAWQVVGMPQYVKNIDEVMVLYNAYFNAASTRQNFTVEAAASNDSILSSEHTYILLRKNEWTRLTADPVVQAQYEQDYQAFFEPRDILVFLKAR